METAGQEGAVGNPFFHRERKGAAFSALRPVG